MLLGKVNFCADTISIWRVIGYFVLIIKIVIPLLLIVFGMIDLGKAVVASDNKDIKTATGSLVKRFIAAIAIFFIPTLVSAVFSLLNVINEDEADYGTCIQCVTNVTGKCEGEGQGSILH